MDRKVPGLGGSGFVTAALAGALVHGTIKSMAVNGCGGGIEPEAGRVSEGADDLSEKMRGDDAGVVDVDAVVGRVAAVDAATGEIDADVGAFEVLRPEAGCLRIPVDGLPLSGVRAAGENDDVMSALLEISPEHATNLAAASGNDNAQRPF